ncbi:hypothetical protein ACQB60_44760 [Actinomycetota bacterium Odt1-20B]
MAAAVALLAPVPAAAAAAPAGPVPLTVQLRDAVALLPTAVEHATGYRRTAFKHWVDADHDGCTTREEILKHEATDKVTLTSDCRVTSGEWYSYYDDQTISADPARQIDIDHMVPLKEAWASGAYAWDAKRR